MSEAPAASENPQTSLYETTIENPELEALLDRRATLKEKASKATKEAAAAHEAVVTELDRLDIADAPVRIGRWVVALRPVAGRSVSFETGATERLVIKPLPEV